MERKMRYEYLGLIVVLILAILVRVFAGRNSLTENGVLFYGYDEYYHMRRILYTIDHFPSVLWFDSYLNYPRGLKLTWPPLFDQLAAAVSLAMGQHSKPAVEVLIAFLPIFLGSIAIVLIYYLTKELFDRKTALLTAFMVTIAPYFVKKTMIGAIDHHSLEVLLALGVLFFLVLALTRKDKLYVFSIASGIMMAGLIYTWLGSPIYLGIVLIYAFCQMTLDLKQGSASNETIMVLLTAFCVSLILSLPFRNAAWMQFSFISIIIIIIVLILLFAMSKLMAKKKVHWVFFPAVSLFICIIFFVLSMTFGDRTLNFQAIRLIQIREYLLGGGMIGKIAEAQPLLYTPELLFSKAIFSNLGWSLIFSLAGVLALIYCLTKAEDRIKRGLIMLLVWSISLLILTFGQVRFLYFSNVIMCILISNLFFQILDSIERRRSGKSQSGKWLISSFLLLILILPMAAEVLALSNEVPPIAGDWYETLNWMEANTNNTSWFDDPSEVPEYSVMSWWDYGNWIVYQGRRPVVANNFQTGISDSGKFFLSDDEENSTAIMNARGSRYILTDYDMLYGKLPAIAFWINEDPSSYMRVEDFGSYIIAEPSPRLLNTTLAKLHFGDGSGMGHFRLIFESSNMLGYNHQYAKVKLFEYVPGAVIRIDMKPNQQAGVLLNMTTNQGRNFQYFNMVESNDSKFEIRVPYSTEDRYETHALNPYLIFLGNSDGIRIQNLEVSEEDVLEERIINVNF
ncbi:MAG: oligosaccharyl transferase, archaeosortase A system-associated [Methanotrichaceae archaeon]|nr:oligosaccharyl transferase, archaeosortase A system-associated [Methanotrichaceae archaeon]